MNQIKGNIENLDIKKNGQNIEYAFRLKSESNRENKSYKFNKINAII